MTLPTDSSVLDVRTMAPSERHPRIFSIFGALAVRESMELVNDHDPYPLHAQFQIRLPDQFRWQYLQSGPGLWRVRITKVERPALSGQCCGSCGGA